jgi:acetyltransferase
MSHANIEALFKPSSVAVIGARGDGRSPGDVAMRNLLGAGFAGPVMPVAEDVSAISGVLTYDDVDSLPLTPDLALICSGPRTLEGHVRALAGRGTRAAMLLTPPPGDQDQEQDAESGLIEAAGSMRLLGPGSLGAIVPASGLNASLAHTNALAGGIAFLTQSESLFTTVLDWTRDHGIGFSHLISLGEQWDVNIHQVIDHLSSDPHTRSILLYIEHLSNARRFMSAARASARNKPILVIKPGQVLDQATPAQACPIETTSRDAIYDVAFRRAGIVRVDDIDALFDGAQTLARSRPLKGDKLAILTNGRSAGLLAADALLEGRGSLAEFNAETRGRLADDPVSCRSQGNPVVLPFDADGKQYAEALGVLLKAKGVNAVLVLHVPFAEVDTEKIASAVAEAASRAKRTLLTCWLGSEAAEQARRIFATAEIPTYETPSKAIRTFLHMVYYRRNQEMLMQTPDSLPSDFFPDTSRAREIMERALDEDRSLLGETEARDVLAAYGVPVVETRAVKSGKEAVRAAEDIGYPVALKVRSAQVSQPFDVGGVALDLETAEEVWDEAAKMAQRVHRLRPDAYIDGYTIQKMGRRPGAHELFIGMFVDPVFGPILRFGHGGMAMRLIRDTSVALPPLNMTLAREMVFRTRIARLLEGAEGVRKADIDDICLTLIQISQLIADLPHVVALEINPLFADDKGVLALGAKIWVGRPGVEDAADRLAIRPYPRELEECANLRNGDRILLRPIRPEDAQAHFEFVKRIDEEDLRYRFFGTVRAFEFSDMAGFTQIDYDREMAFIAVRENVEPTQTLGVVRASTDPDNVEAEFAIVVRSDMKGQGLGSILFDKLIRYCRARGTDYLTGQALADNKGMIGLSKKFGFEVTPDPQDPDLVNMRLPLSPGDRDATDTGTGRGGEAG